MTMQRIFFQIVVIALLHFMFHGCESSSGLSGKNITHLYSQNQVASKIDVEYSVTHLEQNRSSLNYRIDLNDLFDPEDSPKGATIRYRLYQNYNSQVSMDSGYFVLKELPLSGFYDGVQEIEVPSGRNYMLEIDLIDLSFANRTRSFIDIVNSNSFSNQSYKLKRSNDKIVMKSFVEQADSFFVQCNQQIEDLHLRFYGRNFPIASPPFSAVDNKPFDFTPDSLIVLRRNEQGDFVLYVTKSGMYQVVTDTLSRSGGTIFYFGEHYPKSKTVMDLILPLRYITTSPEYYSLTNSENLKKGVDNYWLKVGGNPERAKMLINTYYSRVETSNERFSSYIEGWKSDRGMCYIVYGPPTKVLRNTASETWLYGDEGHYNTLKLTFTKVQNPFSNNDFRLDRNASLKSPWYRAVEFWRQGRIITY
jgi:GWxTD domain-containing protein